jgi:hypothetical protein
MCRSTWLRRHERPSPALSPGRLRPQVPEPLKELAGPHQAASHRVEPTRDGPPRPWPDGTTVNAPSGSDNPPRPRLRYGRWRADSRHAGWVHALRSRCRLPAWAVLRRAYTECRCVDHSLHTWDAPRLSYILIQLPSGASHPSAVHFRRRHESALVRPPNRITARCPASSAPHQPQVCRARPPKRT